MRNVQLCVLVVATAVWTLAVASEAEATPRMSATSGAPCATCHVSEDGGGIRSEIGFGNQVDNVAVDYEQMGISFLAEQDTNYVTDWLALGVDARVQMARLGAPTLQEGDDDELEVILPERRVFPMQFEPSVVVWPADWLTLHGSYNPGEGVFDGDLCSGTYPGQMCGTAQAMFDFDPTWPRLRAGLFRPNFGIHHDDHTMLIESDASGARPELIPPNYAEVGAEVNYQPRHWWRADAGVYRSDQLAAAVNDSDVVQPSDPAAMARVTFYPQFDAFDEDFYGWAGASTYASGHLRGEGAFRMDKAFFGLGMLDRAALMLDVAHLDFTGDDARRAINASTTLAVEVLDWLVPQLRVEQAMTFHDGSEETDMRQQAAAGVQIYPIPFVKLQPEYRYIRTDDWQMGQYMVQLHLHY